ncbi:MAG TPA: penicillin acylase family protein, partial [Bryobacteraceae bacterium]
KHELGYAWAPPSRYNRIVEMLTAGKRFGVSDFARMQQDTVSLPAREFAGILKEWHPEEGSEAAKTRLTILSWDANVALDSKAALLYEVWIEHLHDAIRPKGIASQRLTPDIVLQELKASPERDALLRQTLERSLREIRDRLGPDQTEWKWGHLHKVYFQHPLGAASLNLPPHERPGDGYTVNATGGTNYVQKTGASYRQVLDLSDWDRSVMTNVPGESGNPGNPHYGDLIEGWAQGHYHSMPYSRKAVEAAAEERVMLTPGD